MIYEFEGIKPKLSRNTLVFPNAIIVGDVKIGEYTSIWPNAVIRGDLDSVKIGKYTHIQDNAVVHTDFDRPVEIGDYVTIAHNAVIHGCLIEDEVVVGIGAIVLDGAKVRSGSLIGAGALVGPKKEIPENSVVLGVPGKIVRKQTNEERKKMLNEITIRYSELLKRYDPDFWRKR
ncbi:MAG: gamma carbonic anhydrase family protein [Candidatus Hydrothermarchaeota archaeon]